jgi:hypothetical protein
LKKRTKKLLECWAWAVAAQAPMNESNKSFLMLFFKKELLAFP